MKVTKFLIQDGLIGDYAEAKSTNDSSTLIKIIIDGRYDTFSHYTTLSANRAEAFANWILDQVKRIHAAGGKND